MSLRSKIVLVTLVILVLTVLLIAGILRLVVRQSFTVLERTAAQRDMIRCTQAIQNEIGHLDDLTHDWSAWDDTYTYVVDHNAAYVAANLLPQTFTSAAINLLYIVDTAGQVVWGQVYDLRTGQEVSLLGFPQGVWPADHPLLDHRTPDGSIRGVVITERNPLLVVARPIVTSEEQGPVRGAIIMGRFLDEEAIAAMREQVDVEFHLWPVAAPIGAQPAGEAIPADQADLLAQFSPQQPFVIREQSADLLWIYTQITGLRDEPALLLRADIPREITVQGRIAERLGLLFTLVVGVILLLVMLVFLQRVIVRPVGSLTQHVLAIGASGDLSKRLALNRDDEIGVLAREFDSMVAQLAEARQRLLEQSYYSGMAEMAAGALHNLGNALNPLVIRHDSLRRTLQEAPLDNLERALDELGNDSTPAKRRAKLAQYVPAAARRLVELGRELAQGLDAAAQQMLQIERILADQERFSRAERVVEPVELADLLDDALLLAPDKLQQALTLVIAPEVAAIGPVSVPRTALLQVLGNLLTNAGESISRAGRSPGAVRIGAVREMAGDRPVLHLSICDDGAGIASGDLARLFERGFTTKEHGRGGLGLHWCANVVASMQGRLYAESAGPGQGACFHLILPFGKGSGEKP